MIAAGAGEYVADMNGLAQSSIELQHFASYLFLRRSGKFGCFVHYEFECFSCHEESMFRSAIAKPHFMSPFLEGHKIPAAKRLSALLDCFSVAGFRFLFKLRNKYASGAVLRGRRQLTEAFHRLF